MGSEIPGGSSADFERERKRREANRPLEEFGEGESEGFELAEEQLIEHASHGDQHNTTPIIRHTRDNPDEEDAPDAELYGDADEVPSDVRDDGAADDADANARG